MIKTRFNGFVYALLRVISIMSLILSTSTTQAAAQVAIVLDDVGNSLHDFQALELPTAITFAILPYTNHAKKIASLAKQQHREWLVHVPMQAKAHNRQLGKGALLLNMSEQQFKDQLQDAIAYLPGATGISNHMGSAMTEHIIPMRWTMDILAKQGLYFLDSRTTINSMAQYCARLSDTPSLRRHVFLDNIKESMAMETQFQHALKIANASGSVVIIAHPYPSTISFLAEKFKTPNEKVQLVTLQTLLPHSERLAMAKKRGERYH